MWALPSPIKLYAAPNQYLVWQLAVVEIFRGGPWANISNIRVEYGKGCYFLVFVQLSEKYG
eukprot:SAG31_NODE_27546_length_424_cov_0.864615_2_plen_60_part_01